MDETWLKLAIRAIQNNELPKAWELLHVYTRYYTQDERGWLWLSRATEDVNEKADCLRRVLEINPASYAAISELTLLNQPASHSGILPPAPREQLNDSASRPDWADTQGKSPRANTVAALPVIGKGLKWLGVGFAWMFFVLAAILFFTIATAVFPIFSGSRTLVVLSGSMEPTIHIGAAAIVEPIASQDLQVGDVIAYTPNPAAPLPIIHRIVNIEARNGVLYYTTRGDSNDAPDVAEFALPPTAWRVQYTIPLVGYIVSYASGPLGNALLIFIPILGLVALGIVDGLRKILAVLEPSDRKVSMNRQW